MKSFGHYCALTLVLIIGITSAHFLEGAITTYAIEFKLEKERKKLVAEIDEQKRQDQIRKGKQSEIDKENRRRDTIGRNLAKICQKWFQASIETPNNTTHQKQIKHCKAYQSYVLTGRTPKI